MYHLTHKKQTKLNDCWYACIQMIKTHRFGTKAKPIGSGVSTHRTGTLLGKSIWGNPLGGDDPEFEKILKDNNLRQLTFNAYTSMDVIEQCLNLYGPIIFGGDFGIVVKNVFTGKAAIRAGHYIVVVGVDRSGGNVIVHDPDKKHGPTPMPIAAFQKHVWKDDVRTILVNDGGYGAQGIKRTA